MASIGSTAPIPPTDSFPTKVRKTLRLKDCSPSIKIPVSSVSVSIAQIHISLTKDALV